MRDQKKVELLSKKSGKAKKAIILLWTKLKFVFLNWYQFAWAEDTK